MLLLKRKKGFLNFEFTNNGQTLIGTFHDTDDPKIMDKFVVSKDIKGEKSFSNKNPVQYDNNNYYFTSYHEKTGISHNKNNQLF